MLLLCALLSPAFALQSAQSGPLLELGAGGALAFGRPAFAAHLTTGWWFGRYDDEYALGRFTGLVIDHRLDLGPGGALRYAPVLGVRRAMDLFVVAPYYAIGAGPLVVQGSVGGTVRAAGGLKFRRSRRLGFTARLEAGFDALDGTIRPTAALMVGAGWSSPVRRTR